MMDGQTPETCDECGFDARSWRRADARTLLSALGTWWQLATDGIGSDDLNRRPGAGVWSTLEYGVHSSLVTAMLGQGIDLILGDDRVRLSPPPGGTDASISDDAAVLDRDAVIADIEREATALAAMGSGGDRGAWQNIGLVDGNEVQAEAALIHAAHDASHHQMDVGRGLATIGAGTPAHQGAVAQVNASGGGVPKHPVAGGRVGFDGLAGDTQADRKHHGRPFQALSLWSTEVIDELAAQGHSIAPGYAGENITVSGLDWTSMRPGTRLRIGTALAEVSFPATPCKKQSGWFTDGDFRRIAHERNPQWVRWYAWVREPGMVAPGDEVLVQPR
jgi:MOSC domain-containing protein YiiM